MLRPRVTHSAAHRNIRQKRPWMEYSGTTSWGGRMRGQLPGTRTDPSFKGTEGSWDSGGAPSPHRDLGIKGVSSLPLPPGGRADQAGPRGVRPWCGSRESRAELG